jgi:hypothetical protein
MLGSSLIVTLVLAGSTAFAEPALPPSPAAATALGTGTKEERTACAPDAVKYCNHELDAKVLDTVAILGCLQRNRQKVTDACRTALTNHGQ